MMGNLFKGVMVLVTVLGLAACWDDNKTGPVEIHWDRDGCELCQMLVSDPRFAAEVRGGPKMNIHKFDDIGCAVNWLNGQTWASDPKTEIWVADGASTREKVVWLNAREARYTKGELTPMNYGYTASSGGDGVDFVTMTTAILADTPNHICKVPERHE